MLNFHQRMHRRTTTPWIETILNSLVPSRCTLCAASANHGICVNCDELLPWITIGCEICGSELPEVGVCGACQAQLRYFDHALIPFNYHAPISTHILNLKYQQKLEYADSLAAMICQRAWQDAKPLPDLLIPVPLHPLRLRQRGFNQALEIARRVGAELGVAVDYSSLTRVKNTIAQVGLSESARQRNVRGAFRARALPKNSHVALIDDVVTSGSTVDAAARALKKVGVARVSIWAAAKTRF